MNSTDKTRQRLMDSMRKTKAAAAGKKGAAKKKASQPVRQKAKQERASNAAASSTGKRSVDTIDDSRSVNPDSYQLGRKVWPD